MIKRLWTYRLAISLSSVVFIATSCSNNRQNDLNESYYQTTVKTNLKAQDFGLKGLAKDNVSNINKNQWILSNKEIIFSGTISFLINEDQISNLQVEVNSSNQTIIDISFELKSGSYVDANASIATASKVFNLSVSGFEGESQQTYSPTLAKTNLVASDFNFQGSVSSNTSKINSKWVLDNKTKLFSGELSFLNQQEQVYNVQSSINLSNQKMMDISLTLKEGSYIATDNSIATSPKKFTLSISGFAVSESLPQETHPDWVNLPPGSKKFSEDNSFKIEFQISSLSELNNDGMINRNILNSGTAWSWYYQKNSENLYDWYLITNLHVINGVAALFTGNSYTGGLIDTKGLIDYYSKNTEIDIPLDKGYYFDIQKYSTDTGRYKSLIHLGPTSATPDIVKTITSIKLITDFNNDSVDLFSKANSSGSTSKDNVIYNMDMALIKISFDFSNDKQFLDLNYQRPNVVELYKQNPTQIFDPSKKYYLAGNPDAIWKLLGAEIQPEFYMEYYSLPINNAILEHLKAPYFYTKEYIEDYKLTPGTSGSAVYQFIDGKKLEDNVPIGIYWGGLGKTILPTPFKPSIIPFVYDFEDAQNNKISINIFDNFIQWLNIKNT